MYSGQVPLFPETFAKYFCVYRNQQIAERHSRQSLLRKYFVAWQVWAQGEQERRDLERAQQSTRSKMALLLEAAATGKLWDKDEESVAASGKPSARGAGQSARDRNKRSTADKIVSNRSFPCKFEPLEMDQI